MGNTSSSTTYRRVQPSLVHTFKYNRLLSSSRSDSQEPLLVDNHDQNVEQLILENETNQRKKESLEKQNAVLEKDMRDFKAAITLKKEMDSGMENKVAALEKQVAELKSTISMLKSVSSKPQLKRATETNLAKDPRCDFEATVRSMRKPDSDRGNKVAALEKQVADLKSDHSRLKSMSSQTFTPGLSGSGSETTHLKKKVERLKLQLMKQELDNSTRKLDKETAAQKIAELEKQLLELTPTHKTKPTSYAGLNGSGSETTHLKKKVERLKLQLMKLEHDYSTRKLDKETAAQKIAELEKQLLELTPTHKTKPASSVVTWSYTYTRPGYSHKNRRFVPKDWWTEDISDLDIDLFRYISAVESTKILPPQLIGEREALHVYASHWLPNGSIKSDEDPESSSSASQSERKDMEKRILETIVRMIPADKGAVSVGFLLRLLRISYVIVGTSPVTKAELVRLSSEKLEEATVNDLLIYSGSDHDDKCIIYDVELVELVLESFVIQWRRRQQQHSAGLRSIQKIGKLVDSYLQVVAMEMNMPVAKFVSLAKALPETARSDHDGLYKGIHIYLAEHPDMVKAEKNKLCSVLNPQKLSRHVRGHAVRNKQLPLRIVVQLLFFEHEEIQVSKTIPPMQTHFEHDQRIISHKVEESAHTVRTHHKTTRERQGVNTQEGSSGAVLHNAKEKYVRNDEIHS